jgi:ubiquinone/menaquinone biosynthesis C-methylase UbiE
MNDKLPGFFEGTELPTDWWEALWPDPADVVLRVGIKPGTDVIDLCCGDGWFTLPMARIARRVLALDIDAALVEAARSRLTAAGVTNCDFIVGDAYDVATLSPGPADYVLMANAFHGVPDRERLARAVAKVLRPGGRFAIVNWHSRPREETVVMGEPRGPETRLRIGAEIVRQAVEPSGLKFADVVDVPPYHYAALFEKPGG